MAKPFPGADYRFLWSPRRATRRGVVGGFRQHHDRGRRHDDEPMRAILFRDPKQVPPLIEQLPFLHAAARIPCGVGSQPANAREAGDVAFFWGLLAGRTTKGAREMPCRCPRLETGCIGRPCAGRPAHPILASKGRCRLARRRLYQIATRRG